MTKPIDLRTVLGRRCPSPHRRTAAGRRQEILTDMAGETSMNRLLQATWAAAKRWWPLRPSGPASAAGYQAALLAPTEILASQHAENLNRLLSPFGMRVALLTGGMKAAARRTTLAAIRNDEADLIVGTHAILSEGVEFARLGLAVVDEQHRFGVRQRGPAGRKGREPPPAGHERHPHPPHAGAADVRRPRHLHPRRAAAGPQAGQDPVHHRQKAGATSTGSWIERSTPDDRCISSAPPSRTPRAAG